MLAKISIAGMLLSLPMVASAQVFELDAKVSSNVQSTAISLPFGGTLIGDYDAEANPDGTQSRPGFFGGSGNNPIGYNASFNITGDTNNALTGSMSIDIDIKVLAANINSMSIDLLGGEAGELALGMTLETETFHTVNPTSIYPGGFEIPIPLGSAEVISSVLVSEGVSPLVLEGPTDGIYSVSGVLVGLATTVIVTPFSEDPQEITTPLAVPVTGTLIEGPMGWTISLSFASNVDEEGATKDVPPIENIPLPFPTIPPSSNTANLLMSGQLSGYRVVSSQSIFIVAYEVESTVPGDLDGDGEINGADMGLLLVAWGTVDPGAADINGDGVCNGADLGLLLNAWTG
jgi:hypothetical protein